MVKGVFIGTFDPIHLGHVQFAVRAQEWGDFEQILVIPAQVSPFKIDRPPVAGHHRLAMCRLAFEGWPLAKVLDIEVARSGPSFTIDTIRQLKKTEPSPLRLLIASELAEGFGAWKEAEMLCELAPPAVFAIRDFEKNRPNPRDPLAQVLCAQAVEIPSFEVSSTEIRERLRRGLWCGHLLPQNVLRYIHQHKLYPS